MKAEQQVRDVIDDLVHWANRATTNSLDALKESDPWLQFPSPSGSGHLLSGERTRAAVEILSRAALKAGDLEHRVDFSDTMRELMCQLSIKFLKDENEINQKNADRLLSGVNKWAKRQISDWEFYIPIRFIFQTDDVEIDVGDVRYRPLTHIMREHAGELKGLLSSNETDLDSPSKDQARAAFEYYRNYKWVASVTVAGFDRKTAERTAEDALSSSMDCCYIAFGRQATDRLRAADFNIAHDQRARVFRKKNGRLSIWTSVGLLDGVRLPDDWDTWLNAHDLSALLRLSGVAIQAVSRGERKRTLSLRFLDAARWFGEGVRDRTNFGKVVKYVTALERALAAGSAGDISKMIRERTANLLYDPDARNWETLEERVSKAYDLRSRLVHGELSSGDPKVAKGVKDVGDVTEELLAMILYRIGKNGLLATDITEKRYAEWHDEIAEHISMLRDG